MHCCIFAGIALHLDGARLLNAAVYLDVDPKTLTQPFDSVNLCLSKVGSHVTFITSSKVPDISCNYF